MTAFDNMNMRARLQQFDLQHGDDGIVIGGMIVFSDGAMRDTSPLGPLMDPDSDLQKRRKVQIQYWEEKVRRAVDTFNERKRDLLTAAKDNLGFKRIPPPPCDAGDAVEQLKQLRQVVRECQAGLEDARVQANEAKPDWMRQQDAENLVNTEQNEQFVTALSGIEV